MKEKQWSLYSEIQRLIKELEKLDKDYRKYIKEREEEYYGLQNDSSKKKSFGKGKKEMAAHKSQSKKESNAKQKIKHNE